MVRSRLAESGLVFGRAHSCGEPDAAFGIEHGIVDGGLAVPNCFPAPVRRGIGNIIVLAGWCLGIEHLGLDLAPAVRDRASTGIKSLLSSGDP